jgi:Zn-dependent metalloprotease
MNKIWLAIIGFLFSCNLLFSNEIQNENNDYLVKSFVIDFDNEYNSVQDKDINDILKSKLNGPKEYDFVLQVVKGTKDKTSETDEFGFTHQRYSQYYKGFKIENSDIRVHLRDNLLVS